MVNFTGGLHVVYWLREMVSRQNLDRQNRDRPTRQNLHG